MAIPVKLGPLREVFSLLVSVTVIILPSGIPVNPIGVSRPLLTAFWPANDCDRPSSGSATSPSNLAAIGPILTKECGLQHLGLWRWRDEQRMQ